MECLSSSTPVAKKRHTCDSCGAPILSGQKYDRAAMVDGGDFWTWKSHLPCTKAGRILMKSGYDNDGALINVSDMDHELRETVRAHDPALFEQIWPEIYPKQQNLEKR